jgi:uncharacterized protein with PQ loop repeat
MASIFGTLAMIASLTITFIGLPCQIYKNWRDKDCHLALELIVAAIFSYSLWSMYGWAKPDWFLAGADTPGAILALIVLLQFFLYRKKKRSQTS